LPLLTSSWRLPPAAFMSIDRWLRSAGSDSSDVGNGLNRPPCFPIVTDDWSVNNENRKRTK
jgi:hypothetical protein